MTFWEIAAYSILILIVLVVFRIFSKPMKGILWLCLNSALGWIGLSVFNMIAASSGFAVATNIVTAATCGLLGIPGFVLLVILKFVFNV